MSKFNSGRASLMAIFFSLLLGAFFLGKSITSVSADTKWTVCHATGSVNNPYTRIVVDSKSQGGHFDNNGDPTSAHSLDVLYEGEVGCPEEGVDAVFITRQSISCGTQSVQILGTASFKKDNRDLLVYLDSIEILDATDEPVSWGAGTYQLGIGDHTVIAQITKGGVKATDSWTFTINACSPQCRDDQVVVENTCACPTGKVETDGVCVTPTRPIYGCMDQNANNFNPNATEQGTVVCTYPTHRWCALQQDDSYLAQAIPNNQVDPAGKPWEPGMDRYCVINQEEPTPTPTPLVCTGDQHLDAAGLNCVSFDQAGPPQRNDENIGQVLGASATGGQVLGASTMAKTGGFEENLYLAIMGLGGIISSLGASNFKKASKRA